MKTFTDRSCDGITKKTRILLVIDGLEFGGGERVFLQLAAGLKDRFEILAAATPGGDFEREIRNLEIRFLPLDQAGRFSFKSVLALRKILISHRIDLAHSQGARTDFYARLAGLAAGNPNIVNTITMPVEGFDVPSFRKKIYRVFDRLTERFAGLFIAVSDSLEHLLTDRRGIPRDKVVKIYNGIELNRYSPRAIAHSRHEIVDGSPAIGAVGRLVWQKGFEYLVLAMPEIVAQLPAAKLTLVGDGALRNVLEDLARQLKVENSVCFAGYRNDVDTILPSFDIVAVPSVKEGFPMVTLEAMAMAKPIVTSRIPGIIEQISDRREGILVPPKKPKAIAKAVAELHGDAQLAGKLGAGARKKVETRFSVEKMIRNTEKAYLSLLKKCPYCGIGGKFHFHVGIRTFYRCPGCGLVFKTKRIDYDRLALFYRENYAGDYSEDQLAGHRDLLYAGIVERIEKKVRVGKILDVGAGYGYFLCQARKRGWSVTGIEPSRQSAVTAKTESGLEIFNGTLKEWQSGELFDAVTFLNVLEHSAEPWNEIKKAAELLKPGGLICLRFPNAGLHTHIHRIAQKFGLAKTIDRFLVFHEYPLTPKFVARLLSDCGFGQIDLYNSPLSEGDPNRLFTNPGITGIVKKMAYATALGLKTATRGKILASPSLEVTAVLKRIG